MNTVTKPKGQRSAARKAEAPVTHSPTPISTPAPAPAQAPRGPVSDQPATRGSSPSLNKVMLIGNLTRDPEVRTTPRGTAVAELSLAMNRFYLTESGERREETTYVDVELWSRQAELAGEYLKKGRSVFIEGRLKLDTWDDKETGKKRSKLRVVGEVMQFLGGRDAGEQGFGQPSRTGEAPRKSRNPAMDEEFDDFDPDGDVPF